MRRVKEKIVNTLQTRLKNQLNACNTGGLGEVLNTKIPYSCLQAKLNSLKFIKHPDS